MKNVTSSTVVENLLCAGVGLAAGYIVKKAVTGRSHNVIVKSLGVILQFGITTIIAQNPNALKSFAQQIVYNLSTKEE